MCEILNQIVSKFYSSLNREEMCHVKQVVFNNTLRKQEIIVII